MCWRNYRSLISLRLYQKKKKTSKATKLTSNPISSKIIIVRHDGVTHAIEIFRIELVAMGRCYRPEISFYLLRNVYQWTFVQYQTETSHECELISSLLRNSWVTMNHKHTKGPSEQMNWQLDITGSYYDFLGWFRLEPNATLPVRANKERDSSESLIPEWSQLAWWQGTTPHGLLKTTEEQMHIKFPNLHKKRIKRALYDRQIKNAFRR